MSDTPPPDEATASEPQPDAAALTAASNRRGALFMAGIFLVLPLLLLFGLGDCGSTEGSFLVEGGPHGRFTLTPTTCDSMQPFGRMGANVHAEGHNDGALYPTVDPIDGPRLDVEVPGSCRNSNGTDCTVFRVPRERCARFDISVEHTNTTVNDVRLVRGHARVDCTLEDGTHVVGDVIFDGC